MGWEERGMEEGRGKSGACPGFFLMGDYRVFANFFFLGGGGLSGEKF